MTKTKLLLIGAGVIVVAAALHISLVIQADALVRICTVDGDCQTGNVTEPKPGGKRPIKKPSPEQPPTFHEILKEAYKYYPSAKIGTGILLDMGAILHRHLVKKANGIADELDPPTFDAIRLSRPEFWDAYGDVRRSAFDDPNLLPESGTLKDQAQVMMENGVNPIALTAAYYNELNPADFASGTLSLFYADGTPYPTSTPYQTKADARNDGKISYVKETPASSTTPLLSLFLGTGFFNEKMFGTRDNRLVFSMPSQFVTKNPAGTTLTDIAIRFPDVPGGSTFVSIQLDEKYRWDMSQATFEPDFTGSTNLVAHLTYDVRATINGQVRYAVGAFDYYLPPGAERGGDCSPGTPIAKYPSERPWWWPDNGYLGSDWQTKPLNPLDFFSPANPEPIWWYLSNIAWIPSLGFYNISDQPFFPSFTYMGRSEEVNDPKVIGPEYTDYADNPPLYRWDLSRDFKHAPLSGDLPTV